VTSFGYDLTRPRHAGPFLRIPVVVLRHLCGEHQEPDPRCVACVRRAQQ